MKTKTQTKKKKNPTLGLEPPIRATFRQGSQDQAKVQFRGPTQGLNFASNESKWVPRDLDPGLKKAQFLGPLGRCGGQANKGSPLDCAHKAHKFAVQLQCKREREREREKREREMRELCFCFPSREIQMRSPPLLAIILQQTNSIASPLLLLLLMSW